MRKENEPIYLFAGTSKTLAPKQGPKKLYYITNGKLKNSENYKDGVKDGLQREYFINGKLQKKEKFISGKLFFIKIMSLPTTL